MKYYKLLTGMAALTVILSGCKTTTFRLGQGRASGGNRNTGVAQRYHDY